MPVDITNNAEVQQVTLEKSALIVKELRGLTLNVAQYILECAANEIKDLSVIPESFN